MFALSRSSCSSRSPFFENRARPLHAFLLLSPFRGPRSRPQTPTAIGAYGNWPENAHVGVWLRWVEPVFFGVAGEENKARAACRADASKIPGRPSKAPPNKRCWWECISPELAAEFAEGGHRPGQLLSGIRRTDAFPANPGWGLAQERPENWSTVLSETGTTGPTPRQGSISKISPPRSAPMVHLCQQLLSVGSEITMSAHDRRPPPARPLHHP